MVISGLDHIVLCVRDVAATVNFYETILGLEPREERPGKWSLHFGHHKISLVDQANMPDLAKGTVPGSGNFCLITDTSLADVSKTLSAHGVNILDSGERSGAVGPIMSLYFNDPDGNLVEVSNHISNNSDASS